MPAMGENAKRCALILAMLVFGSWNTINSKFQFQTCAPTGDSKALDKPNPDGCQSGWVKFNKPWVQNFFMFSGEACVILFYGLTRRSAAFASPPCSPGASPVAPRRMISLAGGWQAARRHAGVIRDGLLPPRDAEGEQRKTPFYIFAIPAFCDVFGTGLASVGMMYLDSAIWQMLRSSIIIFSAVVSVCFLKRRLQPFHWLATFIVFCGLIIVGVASSLDASADSHVSVGERLLGISLVVFAQLCAAFQMVFEEKLLTGRVKTSAKKVVGMEGLWGLFFMIIALGCMTSVPGSDNGSYESLPDSLRMIRGSGVLLFFLITFMFSIAIYNLCGITVGKKLSAVVRCLVDSCRTIVVWAVNLILYYAGFEQYGTPWTDHTWLTVVGFLVLVLGTLLYNEVLPPPPCLTQPMPEATDENEMPPQQISAVSDGLAKLSFTEEEPRARENVNTDAWPRAAEVAPNAA